MDIGRYHRLFDAELDDVALRNARRHRAGFATNDGFLNRVRPPSGFSQHALLLERFPISLPVILVIID